jgi:hypothetical protein
MGEALFASAGGEDDQHPPEYWSALSSAADLMQAVVGEMSEGRGVRQFFAKRRDHASVEGLVVGGRASVVVHEGWPEDSGEDGGSLEHAREYTAEFAVGADNRLAPDFIEVQRPDGQNVRSRDFTGDDTKPFEQIVDSFLQKPDEWKTR